MKRQLKVQSIAGILSIVLLSCYAQQKTQNVQADPAAYSFPGAEGFGRYTTGGRGGKVFIVTNLNDNGPGSFREAATAKMPRIIVFAISGTIHLETKLSIASNVTIAGQTAPGDGICLADNSVMLGGDNIIVRFMRFRMGDKYQRGGMVDGNGGDDAFGGTRRKNIMIDHCSASWSTDEVFSIYGGDSTTIQWNMIYEPLNYSYHFETGDKDYERHGFGAIWGGRHLSAHHNLFAHCNNRTPRFDGIRNIPEENVDYRNNVIYNWGANNIYAGEGGHYNLVNNYFRYGPSTNANARSNVFNPYNRPPNIPWGKFFIEGNYMDGSPDVTANNWKGVHLSNGDENAKAQSMLSTPTPSVDIAMQSAANAYKSVLEKAGAILPKRDTLDERIIKNVKDRTGGLIDVQGGYPHGTPYEQTLNAWPALRSLPAPVDTDQDGMPDEWEKRNGLNPNNASDATEHKFDGSYTNIEIYINSLVPKSLWIN